MRPSNKTILLISILVIGIVGLIIFNHNIIEISRIKAKAVIFTGRWEFLRIQFPYLLRELKINGGALDQVIYSCVKITENDLSLLEGLVNSANQHYGREYFKIHKKQKDGKVISFGDSFNEIIFKDILNKSDKFDNVYFKIDDDVIYLDNGITKDMISQRNPYKCIFYHPNIATSNWRCNVIHQSLGLFTKHLNPLDKIFEFDPFGPCSWKSPICAMITHESFFHYYNKKQLDQYRWNPNGPTPMYDKTRFSINMIMVDSASLVPEKIKNIGGKVSHDEDEFWLSQQYPDQFLDDRANCIISNKIVAHFSYGPSYQVIRNHSYYFRYYDLMKHEHWDNLNSNFKNMIER